MTNTKDQRIRELEIELEIQRRLAEANQNQPVKVELERASFLDNVKTFGLFAAIWHAVGVLFDMMFGG